MKRALVIMASAMMAGLLAGLSTGCREGQKTNLLKRGSAPVSGETTAQKPRDAGGNLPSSTKQSQPD